MNKSIFIILISLFTSIYANATQITISESPDSTAKNLITNNPNFDPGSCSCNGIPLYGKVKVVESFADFEVQIVNSFPDLKVKIVESFPDECGKWKFVESFPDFTVKFVDSFPDFKIKYVESFPGTN